MLAPRLSRRSLGAAVLLTAVMLAGLLGAAAAGESSPRLWRIHYQQIDDLRTLAGYDLLEVNNLQHKYVLAYLSPAERAALQAAGWRLAAEDGTAVRRQQVDLFAGGYHTVDELYTRLDTLAAAYPALTEKVVYGGSHCLTSGGCLLPDGRVLPGYELVALRVSNEARAGSSQVSPFVTAGAKPVFFLMANIHAREIATPELALLWLEYLLENYGLDADVTWLVDYHELWVIPTANPDGHWIVELGDDPVYGMTPMLHRKNGNQDADEDGEPDCPVWPSESFAQFGVDLNRHHSYGWQPSAALSGPCSLTYAGTAPAKEPEVAQLENLIRGLIPDQRGPGTAVAGDGTQGILITLHSYSELVLRPWAHNSQPAPNEAGLKAIGDKLAAYNGYLSCRPGECLYEATGTSDDWAYGELGIPAFTFEVGRSFTPPYAEITGEQWSLNLPAFLYAARIARAPYALVRGPEALEVNIGRGTDGLSRLTATLDGTLPGGRAIAAAEYTIDLPPWADGAVPRPLHAEDGAFDEVTEAAGAPLSPLGLPPGRHVVYVRGQDASGNWGPASAAFVDSTAVSWQHAPVVAAP